MAKKAKISGKLGSLKNRINLQRIGSREGKRNSTKKRKSDV